MSRRRITLHIDRITLAAGNLSRQELAAVIAQELGLLVQQEGTAFREPGSASIRQIESHPINGPGSEVKVGRAIAQAAFGAVKR